MLGTKRIIKPFVRMCLYIPAQYHPNSCWHQYPIRNLAGAAGYRRYITRYHYCLAHLEVHPQRHGKMVAGRSGL